MSERVSERVSEQASVCKRRMQGDRVGRAGSEMKAGGMNPGEQGKINTTADHEPLTGGWYPRPTLPSVYPSRGGGICRVVSDCRQAQLLGWMGRIVVYWFGQL